MFKKYLRLFSNLLIVGYLATIYFSGVPESNTLSFHLKKKATNLAYILGIWPSWSMFAPNPIKYDSKSYVEITYKNGEVLFKDIEIELEGILAPFRKARWMKYAQDNLRNPKQKWLLTPAMKYHYTKFQNPKNPILSISIKRKWWDVPKFTEEVPLIPLMSKHERKETIEMIAFKKFEI